MQLSRFVTALLPIIYISCSSLLYSQGTPSVKASFFDMPAIRDASTLEVTVIEEWHRVEGPVPTRQKLVTINVGEFWPGQKLRMPVRMVVPAEGKAKGFHLTGGNNFNRMKKDKKLSPIEQLLIQGDIGLVQTVVQVLQQSGLGELGRTSEERFLKSLNPHDKIQYWAWPATLMRAITMAHAEKEYFQVGKVAMSGGSKNGATPSLAIIHDDRMTAVHASVSPIWDSPLRQFDGAAWSELESIDGKKKHGFLGGHFGPNFGTPRSKVQFSKEDLRAFAKSYADDVFISRNIPQLRNRKVDLLFHPGTHDFVAYDLSWGGKHHPDIPVYLKANTGHGKKKPHHAAERDEQNKSAFLLEHFFDEVDPLLTAPTVKHQRQDDNLLIQIRFKENAGEQSGRIWWIYDRPIDGSHGYLSELIPDKNWADMENKNGVWLAKIKLKKEAKRIDFFSNHHKPIRYKNQTYKTYLSSPYTRVELKTKQ